MNDKVYNMITLISVIWSPRGLQISINHTYYIWGEWYK